MRAGDFGHRICLADDEEVFYFTHEVFGFRFGCAAPYDEEIGWFGFVTEEGGTYEIVVEGRDGLAGIDVAKLHEGRFILRLDDDWLTQVELT